MSGIERTEGSGIDEAPRRVSSHARESFVRGGQRTARVLAEGKRRCATPTGASTENNIASAYTNLSHSNIPYPSGPIRLCAPVFVLLCDKA